MLKQGVSSLRQWMVKEKANLHEVHLILDISKKN